MMMMMMTWMRLQSSVTPYQRMSLMALVNNTVSQDQAMALVLFLESLPPPGSNPNPMSRHRFPLLQSKSFDTSGTFEIFGTFDIFDALMYLVLSIILIFLVLLILLIEKGKYESKMRGREERKKEERMKEERRKNERGKKKE